MNEAKILSYSYIPGRWLIFYEDKFEVSIYTEHFPIVVVNHTTPCEHFIGFVANTYVILTTVSDGPTTGVPNCYMRLCIYIIQNQVLNERFFLLDTLPTFITQCAGINVSTSKVSLKQGKFVL